MESSVWMNAMLES